MRAVGDLKECSRCKRVLALDAFAKNRSTPDGLQNWCDKCLREYRSANTKQRAAYQQAYVAENRESVNEYQRKYRMDHTPMLARPSGSVAGIGITKDAPMSKQPNGMLTILIRLSARNKTTTLEIRRSDESSLVDGGRIILIRWFDKMKPVEHERLGQVLRRLTISASTSEIEISATCVARKLKRANATLTTSYRFPAAGRTARRICG